MSGRKVAFHEEFIRFAAISQWSSSSSLRFNKSINFFNAPLNATECRRLWATNFTSHLIIRIRKLISLQIFDKHSIATYWIGFEWIFDFNKGDKINREKFNENSLSIKLFRAVMVSFYTFLFLFHRRRLFASEQEKLFNWKTFRKNV